jgi:hypothetical protein
VSSSSSPHAARTSDAASAPARRRFLVVFTLLAPWVRLDDVKPFTRLHERHGRKPR